MERAHLHTNAEFRFDELLDRLLALRAQVLEDVEARLRKYRLRNPAVDHSSSLFNLACYLCLRKHDLRPIQDRLAEVGLSSLGRGESHILANLDRVVAVLSQLAGRQPLSPEAVWWDDAFSEGDRILRERTNSLLGPAPASRQVRIMVTLSGESAGDAQLVESLLAAGMNLARINCAHDDAATWERMITNVRRAESRLGQRCAILMDLAGPKIRTTGVVSELPVKHVKVVKDNFGKVITPTAVSLAAESPGAGRGKPVPRASAYRFTIPDALHANLAEGDRLEFEDARGKERYFEVVRKTDDGSWLTHCYHGAYLTPGVPLRWRRLGSQGHWQTLAEHPLGAFSGKSAAVSLNLDDLFILMSNAEHATPAVFDDAGRLVEPARIGCTVPEVVRRLKPGHSVWIDDGHVGAVVESIHPEGALLRVTHVGPKGFGVRSDKGLNFPDTDLDLPALTAKDRSDLDFVCRHADIVGYSFVQTLADMETLIHELSLRGASGMPIVAKIETRRAVADLPEILLGTMDRHPLCVMIARGDLAVELGSVRFAEIQEELLWVCEAARVPVIWATQVLESLAKNGITSRPEITDAAMSARAECVMLNKGPYAVEAVRVLSDILSRMQNHQHKKGARLRALHLEY